MKGKLRYIVHFFKKVVTEWQKDNGSLIAAGLSFFAIFSLAPLIIISIAIAGHIFESSHAQAMVLKQIADVTTTETAHFIQSLLESAGRTAGTASVIGSLLLLWAASRIFTQLQRALNIIWQASPKPARGFRKILSRVFKRLRAISMSLTLAGVLILFLILDIGIAALQEFLSQYAGSHLVRYVWPAVSFSLSLALFTVAFALIYKWLPETVIAWKDAWVGAAFSSVIFALGRYVISLYFRFSDIGSPFGAAGSVVVVIMWIYFSTEILLFGAEFTWVYANRHRLLESPD